MNSSAHTSYIALGGNQGDVTEAFHEALQTLNKTEEIQVAQVSRFYQTDPVGHAAGDIYTNAAAELITTLSPLELLHVLQEVEKIFGRTRPYHWAPRTLDLDIIFFDDQVIHTQELTVPHPAACYRRFVLAPLADIAPDFLHPELSCSVRKLLEQVEANPFRMLVSGTASPVLKEGLETLLVQFPGVEIDYQPSANTSKPNYSLQISLTGSECELMDGIQIIPLSSMTSEQQLKSITDILHSARGRVTPI